MVTLFEHPLSPYAQKVKIALREKGVAFEVALPGGLGAGGVAGEFAKANPRGEVPVLIDGETAIFDSTIILEYIEDAWPNPALLPATPGARAKARMIEDVMDTHFEAITWGLSELSWFHRATGELAKTLTDNAARQIQGYYLWLTDKLGPDPWFGGETFGWADLSVAPYLGGAIAMGHRPTEGSPDRRAHV